MAHPRTRRHYRAVENEKKEQREMEKAVVIPDNQKGIALAFVMVMCVLDFILGILAGYMLFRHDD